ncbi:hypothetical protein [Collimonas pratensis]|uniref:hypothetical protein n=1 Tax=Collimonas pratensis TaxID=279113 RepID=UPI000783BC4A|nr:hypothetical protein [Collimonas pratensis]
MTTNPITHTDEGALLDDHAVDLIAKAMKAKLRLKREQGFSGWDDISKCSGERLAELLIAAVAKGDPVDVANFAMMLFCRHEHHEALKAVFSGTTLAPILDAKPFAFITKAALDSWLQSDKDPMAVHLLNTDGGKYGNARVALYTELAKVRP